MKISVISLLAFLLMSPPLGATEQVVPEPTHRDKCPVCGMFVAKYPEWLTVIRFKDGTHLFFDGAKDMFKYLLDPNRYNAGAKKSEIAAIMVKEYYGLSWIDARMAWYVIGSDVYGPMGKELIPLETEGDAKEFIKDHKGIRIIRFSDVAQKVIKSLD